MPQLKRIAQLEGSAAVRDFNPPMTAWGQTRRVGMLATLAACPLPPESDRRRSKCDPSLTAITGRDEVQQTNVPQCSDSITSSAAACNLRGTVRRNVFAGL